MWISQLWRSKQFVFVFLASVYTSCTAEGFPTAEIQIRHPGEPGSVPFSLQPDLSPHPPHHPHPLQDKEHPEDYSTDPSITSGDYLKEYDLDDVDEEEIDQFNEIVDEEEYDDGGLEKDQEVEASEPNRVFKKDTSRMELMFVNSDNFRNKKKKKKGRRPVLKRRKVKTTRFRLRQPNQIEDEKSKDDNEINEDNVETTTFADLSRGRPLTELLFTTRSPKTIILSDKILPKSRSRDIEIIIRPDTRIKDLKDDTTTTPPIKSDDNPPADRNLVKEKKPRFTGVRQRSREDRKNILFPPRINKAPGRITFPRGSKIADRNVKSNNDDNNSENEISEEDVDDFKVQEKDSGLRKKVKFPNFETGITGGTGLLEVIEITSPATRIQNARNPDTKISDVQTSKTRKLRISKAKVPELRAPIAPLPNGSVSKQKVSEDRTHEKIAPELGFPEVRGPEARVPESRVAGGRSRSRGGRVREGISHLNTVTFRPRSQSGTTETSSFNHQGIQRMQDKTPEDLNSGFPNFPTRQRDRDHRVESSESNGQGRKEDAKPLVIFESQRSPQSQIHGRKPAQIFPAVPDRNVINPETIDLVDNPSFISQPSAFDNPPSLGKDESGLRPKPSVFDDQLFDLGKGSNSAQEEEGFESINQSTPPSSIFPTQILRTSSITPRPLQQTSPVPKQGFVESVQSAGEKGHISFPRPPNPQTSQFDQPESNIHIAPPTESVQPGLTHPIPHPIPSSTTESNNLPSFINFPVVPTSSFEHPTIQQNFDNTVGPVRDFIPIFDRPEHTVFQEPLQIPESQLQPGFIPPPQVPIIEPEAPIGLSNVEFEEPPRDFTFHPVVRTPANPSLLRDFKFQEVVGSPQNSPELRHNMVFTHQSPHSAHVQSTHAQSIDDHQPPPLHREPHHFLPEGRHEHTNKFHNSDFISPVFQQNKPFISFGQGIIEPVPRPRHREQFRDHGRRPLNPTHPPIRPHPKLFNSKANGHFPPLVHTTTPRPFFQSTSPEPNPSVVQHSTPIPQIHHDFQHHSTPQPVFLDYKSPQSNYDIHPDQRSPGRILPFQNHELQYNSISSFRPESVPSANIVHSHPAVHSFPDPDEDVNPHIDANLHLSHHSNHVFDPLHPNSVNLSPVISPHHPEQNNGHTRKPSIFFLSDSPKESLPFGTPTPIPAVIHSSTPNPFKLEPTPGSHVTIQHFPSPSPIPLIYQPKGKLEPLRPFIHLSSTERPQALPYHGEPTPLPYQHPSTKPYDSSYPSEHPSFESGHPHQGFAHDHPTPLTSHHPSPSAVHLHHSTPPPHHPSSHHKPSHPPQAHLPTPTSPTQTVVHSHSLPPKHHLPHVYSSTQPPHYHSTPAPFYHTTPASLHFSSPAPIYSTTTPLYSSSPAPGYHTTSTPLYPSFPHPHYHSTPAPLYSTPAPVYHSTTTVSPYYQSSPQPAYHSTISPLYPLASKHTTNTFSSFPFTDYSPVSHSTRAPRLASAHSESNPVVVPGPSKQEDNSEDQSTSDTNNKDSMVLAETINEKDITVISGQSDKNEHYLSTNGHGLPPHLSHS